ncbi:MAG: hypothetical protein ACRCTZ_21445 [Sarcina sp.]
MYCEYLYIRFENGDTKMYHPLEKMRLSRNGNEIEISYLGIMERHNDPIRLDHVDEIMIADVNTENYVVESCTTIYNDTIDNIEEFDNLNISSYGKLRTSPKSRY